MAENKINTLNEKPLHADLKKWYARPGDLIEQKVDGYLVDIVRGELLIEIQTRNFSIIKRKLARLAEHHPVRLVYPIAQRKWIVRLDKEGNAEARRRSPKTGRWEHLFDELVYIPHLLGEPNFSVEVLLIHEEEIRHRDGTRAWRRRGWVTKERRLLEVVERRTFESAKSLARFLPPDLPHPFTTRDLALKAGVTRPLAQKIVYCFRTMGLINETGKSGNSRLYERA